MSEIIVTIQPPEIIHVSSITEGDIVVSFVEPEPVQVKVYSNGLSAYDIWKLNGHTGSETDFLNSLKGQKGDKGDAGGAIQSVNGMVGDVVLDPDDLDDTSTAHKFVSSTQIININKIPELLKYISNLSSTGLLTGCALSINADPTLFDIQGSTAIFIDNFTDPLNPTLTIVTWETQTDLLSPYLNTESSTYIGINSSGNLVYGIDDLTPEQRRTIVAIGWLDHSDQETIDLAREQPTAITDIANQLHDFLQNYGSFNIDNGNVYSAYSGLEFQRSEGQTFEADANYYIDKKSPHIITNQAEAPCLFYRYWRDGSGGWMNSAGQVTVVDPEHWDDGSGVLQNVPYKKFTIKVMSFYAGMVANDIQYGQAVYDTMYAAQAGVKKAVEVNPYNIYDTFRCWLIVQQGCTDLTNVSQALFIPSGNTTMTDLESDSGNLDLTDYPTIRQSSIDNKVSGLIGSGFTSNLISFAFSMDPTKFDVGNSTGYINDYSGVSGSYKYILWNNFNNVSPAGNGLNFIAIDKTGDLAVSLTPLSRDNYIRLGFIFVQMGYVITIVNLPDWSGKLEQRIDDCLGDALKAIVATGNIVTEGVTPLTLNIVGGLVYVKLSPITFEDTTNFSKSYMIGSNIVTDNNNLNHVNTNEWNNVNSGLVEMTTGYWKKDLLIRIPNGDVYYFFATSEWVTEDEAKAAPLPALPFVLEGINKYAVYLISIVSKKGDTSIANRIINISPNLTRIFGYGTEGGGSIISYNSLIDKPFIPSVLDDLDDVVITTPSIDQVLEYDGVNWVNKINPVVEVASDGDETAAFAAGAKIVIRTDLL